MDAWSRENRISQEPEEIADSSHFIYPAQYDINFKVILVGNAGIHFILIFSSGVGKSCMAIKGIKGDSITQNPVTTIGFEFLNFVVNLKQPEFSIVKLQVWDTSGQEIYKSLVANFYRSACLAFIVFSIEDRSSFEDIDNWLREIRNNANSDIMIYLIGNKSDLQSRY